MVAKVALTGAAIEVAGNSLLSGQTACTFRQVSQLVSPSGQQACGQGAREPEGDLLRQATLVEVRYVSATPP